MFRYVASAKHPVAVVGLAWLLTAPVSADENPPARMRGKLWVSPIEYVECAHETAFARGDKVMLTGNGLAANTVAKVTFEQGDNVRTIGNSTANAQGAVSVRDAIPADAVVGSDARFRVSQSQPDGKEIVLSSAPLQIFADSRDSDGDGIKDMCDTCPSVASTDLTDLDADGLGDVCDPCPTDPDNGASSNGQCADGNTNANVPLPATKP